MNDKENQQYLLICKECGGRIIFNDGDLYCESCGLMIEDMIQIRPTSLDNKESRNIDKYKARNIERAISPGTDRFDIERKLRKDLKIVKELYGYEEPNRQYWDSEQGKHAAEKRWKKWRKKNGKENDD